MTTTNDRLGALAVGGPTPRRERLRSLLARHPLLLVFGIALLVRVVTAVVIRVHNGGVLFGDDYGYHVMAVQAANGQSDHWDDFTHFLYRENAGLLVPMTLLYRMFGPEVLLGQLLVALAGAATALLAAVLVRSFAGRTWALATGLAVALLPSQVLWSSLTLKDAVVWVVLAAVGVVLARWNQAERLPNLLVGAVGAAACLGVLSFLRDHTMVVTAWAALLSVLVAGGRRWAPRLGLMAVVAVGVPWVAGTGPAGLQLVADNAGSVAEQRMLGAEDAATALVPVAPTSTPAPVPTATSAGHSPGGGHRHPSSAPTVEPTPAPTSPAAGRSDIGTAFGADARTAGGFRENVQYLPHGLAAVVIQPYPWQSMSNGRVQLAKVDDILWYPMLLLAAVGVVTGVRRRAYLAFPAFIAAGTATMWALVEGNFGTAFRHRGEFVWAVAVLAGAGAAAMAERRKARRNVPTVGSEFVHSRPGDPPCAP